MFNHLRTHYIFCCCSVFSLFFFTQCQFTEFVWPMKNWKQRKCTREIASALALTWWSDDVKRWLNEIIVMSRTKRAKQCGKKFHWNKVNEQILCCFPFFSFLFSSCLYMSLLRFFHTWIKIDKKWITKKISNTKASI